MACNREPSTDGASPTSPPPVPSAPGSCSNPDAALAIPCCNNKCHNCGCAVSMNLCSKCSNERLCKEEKSFNVSKHNPDLDFSVEPDAAADVPAITMPTPVMNFKSSASSRFKIEVSAPTQQQFGSCTKVEPRIPSPLSLSPASEVSLPATQERAVNRCGACRKRTGLLGFKCRCGDLFCASHRYSDRHDCSFDYKAAGRLVIAKENPVVVASKIIKI